MQAAQGNAIFAGVLALGAAAAWWGSGDASAVPATALGLAAAAALVPAAVLFAREERRSRGVALALLLLIGAVAAQVFFRPGVPQGHDLQSHSWALYATWRSVLDGDPFPRWTPYIGLGVPLLQFYGPLPWLLCWPAMALGASPLVALKSGLVLAQILGAVATWSAVRGLGGSRAAALLGALALSFAPYRLLDQTYRIAYAEGFALALTPWTLAQAVRVARGEDRVAALALGTAALVLSHPVTGLLLVPLALPLLFLPLWRRPRRVFALLLAGALGLGATAAFWLPMAAEQPATTLSRTAPVGKQLAPLAASPAELVTRQGWTGYDLRRKHDTPEGKAKAVPLYVGCGLLTLAGLGLAAPGRRRESAEEQQPADPRPWALAGLLALAFSTQPTAALLDLVPLYGRIQFPWRFLAPATATLVVAGALSLDRWTSTPARPWLLGGAAALLVFDAVPYLGAADWFEPYEDVVVRGPGDRLVPLDLPAGDFVRVENLRLPPASFAYRVGRSRGIFPEYTNPELRRRYLGRKHRPGRSEALGVSWRIVRRRARPLPAGPLARIDGVPLPDAVVDLRGERIDVDLVQPSPGGRLLLASQSFPGWRARIDGGPWQEAGSHHGLLSIQLPEGARRVDLRYSAWRPWDRAVGRSITLSVLLGLLLAGVRRRRSTGR